MSFTFPKALNLPAFRSHNYRLFFTGQGISLIGTWMTQIATIWLVYQLSESAVLLGVVGFCSQIPSFFLTPFGGVLVDRWNRHRVLLITQMLAMAQSLALAVLALTDTIQIWHIIVLSLFQGCINAIDAPTRQAFVPELLENKDDLPNAIALNSSVFNGARLVGPAIAGIMIAIVGAAYCFLIDGLSYIAVLMALMAMHLKPPVKNTEPISFAVILAKLQEGFRYAFGFAPIRSILLLLALVSFMGMQYTVLAPIFATNILRGDASALGILMSASGIGALIAGAYLSQRRSVLGLGRLIGIAPAIMGFGLIAFSLSRVLWLSALMMVLVGFGFLLQFASSNTLVQTIVEDDKRGRVMSFYIMAFMGMLPLGSLVAGAIANRIGAPATVLIGGVFCIAGSLLFLRQLPELRKIIRPIYVEMGVLPTGNH